MNLRKIAEKRRRDLFDVMFMNASNQSQIASRDTYKRIPVQSICNIPARSIYDRIIDDIKLIKTLSLTNVDEFINTVIKEVRRRDKVEVFV